MSQPTSPPRRYDTRRRRPQHLTLVGDEAINSPVSDEDIVMQDASDPDEPAAGTARSTGQVTFIVAIDYGTTYSSVSFIKFESENRPKNLRGEEIRSIHHWPNSAGGYNPQDRAEVPSESWYKDDEYFWGYNAVRKRKGFLAARNSVVGRCPYPKLLLIDANEKDQARLDLMNTLATIGKTDMDLIKDYILHIIKHTKEQLTELHGYNDTCAVELVLCVPAGWSPTARRTLQEIMGQVAEEAQFGSIYDFWMLHEPEAAAAYVLEALSGYADIRKGETFIVCDAGGGTVDTITYQVENEDPFRVKEVVRPQGCACGSSYINEALQREVTERLKDETYLERDGIQLQHIVENEVMFSFETELKRFFDVTKDLDGHESVIIRGLKSNSEKNFGQSELNIERAQIAEFFRKSIDGTLGLIRRQLAAAERKGLDVKSILLVGGFGASPTLRHYLKTEFQAKLIYPSGIDMATVVSHGAVFRATDKGTGPRRQIFMNYGRLQYEEYDPKQFPSHKNFEIYHNELNGKDYIKDCISWMIKKKRTVSQKQSFISRSYQVFGLDQSLELHETVYMSDDDVKDHIQKGHGCNKSAIVAGILELDLNRLKEDNLIQAVSRPNGRSFYEIDYDVVMEVNGLNLEFYVLYPPGGECQGRVQQICITAAFRPGTA